MGVYGSMLPFFPELFTVVDYYEQVPRVDSGYDKGTVEQIRVILIEGIGQSLMGPDGARSNKSIWHAIAGTDSNVVFSDKPLKLGNFIDVTDRVFRIMKQKNWENQGGYYAYVIEKLTGDNGTQHKTMDIITGLV